MYSVPISGLGWSPVERVVTAFGKQEFTTIRTYCRENDLSIYSLAKAAIREYIKRHSNGGSSPRSNSRR